MEIKCLSLKDLLNIRTLMNKSSFDEPGSINEQKENISMERKKTTPLKSESVTGHWKVSSLDIAHITPIKHPERAHPDPWTPTANLKMLSSAASPEIRNREMKKTLFRPLENEEKMIEEEVEMDESCQYEASDDAERRPSRKQKSLGLLCQKFLALYPDYPETSESISISLDEVATCLAVERRRIYDIVNVLESLMLVSRSAKNMYVWHGRSRLVQTLQELHRAAREQGYHLQINQREEHCAYAGTHVLSAHTSSRRKDKSLRIMSQKFVMLFLVSKSHTVTLDSAAKILIEEGQDESSDSKYKTKVRRLYDIANVLTSLNLIKKLQLKEEKGRKPVFEWIGPLGFHNSNADEPVDYSRKSLGSSEAPRIQFEESAALPSVTPVLPGMSFPSVPASTPLAYLPQTPLLMLYSGHLSEGIAHSSPPSKHLGKRERQEEDEEDLATQRKRRSVSIESEVAETESCSSRGRNSPAVSREMSPWNMAVDEEEEGASGAIDGQLSSHYLYVPNTAGLNSLKFLMPGGHTQGGMPAVAMPCFLVPSPLIASSMASGSEEVMNYGFPSMLSPARFVMAGGAYGVTEGLSSPDHHGNKEAGCGSSPRASGTPPLLKTPVTPKDAVLGSKSFFETPGDFPALTSQSAARKRGSAQRRLDVGHFSAN
ncbi:hypothetical protein DNTS_006221 [Danionella cerebrum]|uniref:Transcription factor E2F7 n=1 Tax=Danionella cerebrum TaxID=2873325 RepID=A0A553QD56_9TELE|nr:hypothetical protein DNTS_006221 [Danionella translucida]